MKRVLAFVPILFSPCLAQGGPPSVLRIQGTFHAAELWTVIPDPSHPGLTAEIGIATASLRLRNDLSFSVVGNEHVVESSGVIVNAPDVGNGTYRVRPDAVLALDNDPSASGTDVALLHVDPDAEIAVGARAEASPDSAIRVALRTSSGQGVASLSGTYAFVAVHLEYDGFGLASSVAEGTGVFDGLGGATFTGQEETISSTGVALLGPIGGSLVYAVAPDGALSFGPTESGGISPNGDVWFVANADPNSAEVGLTIGVRVGAGPSMSALAGDWGFATHEVEPGPGASQPLVYTEFGQVAISTSTPTTGAYAGTSRWVENDPLGIRSGVGSLSGPFVLGGSGRGTFLDPGTMNGTTVTFSANADVLIGTELGTGHASLIAGVRVCGGSGPFGGGTPGAGGLTPVMGMRGFPTLGNQTFAVTVDGAVGAALGVLPIAFGASAGLPFLGGVVWLDPGRILVAPSLVFSGAAGTPGAGSASLGLPVPTSASLVGGDLFFQAFVLDGAAPLGLAMSDGFRVRFCAP